MVIDVKVYIPNPKICRICNKYGHIKKYCRNLQDWQNGTFKHCGNCKSDDHETKDCKVAKEEYKCNTCLNNENHSTYDKTCPT